MLVLYILDIKAHIHAWLTCLTSDRKGCGSSLLLAMVFVGWVGGKGVSLIFLFGKAPSDPNPPHLIH